MIMVDLRPCKTVGVYFLLNEYFFSSELEIGVMICLNRVVSESEVDNRT